MTDMMTRPQAAGAPPVAKRTQKFGGIETLRYLAGGTEADIRRPDGWAFTAVTAPGLAGNGLGDAQEGCNIWVAGQNWATG